VFCFSDSWFIHSSWLVSCEWQHAFIYVPQNCWPIIENLYQIFASWLLQNTVNWIFIWGKITVIFRLKFGKKGLVPFEPVSCTQQHKDHDHQHEHKDHFHQRKNCNESNQLVLQFQSTELLVNHSQNPSYQTLVFDHFFSIPIYYQEQKQTKMTHQSLLMNFNKTRKQNQKGHWI
jgi:hypothetical protein